MSSTYRTRITGTGSAHPPTALTNDEVAARVADASGRVTAAWIHRKTGVLERRVSRPGVPEEFNSALGLAAARRALEAAGKTASDLDQILYATCTPDTLIPSTACWLQGALRADHAWAMDLNAACSGFLYGLAIADQGIRAGDIRTSLVIGADVLSAFTNWRDASSCILFGDGAGAAVLERAPSDAGGTIVSWSLGASGHLAGLFGIPAGGSRRPVTTEDFDLDLLTMRMDGRALREEAERAMAHAVRATLAAKGLSTADVAWVLPHQANLRIVEAVARDLALPMARVLVNLDRFGNTSAATIPSLLDGAVRDGRIRPGDLLVLVGFGAGLTHGCVLVRW